MVILLKLPFKNNTKFKKISISSYRQFITRKKFMNFRLTFFSDKKNNVEIKSDDIKYVLRKI